MNCRSFVDVSVCSFLTGVFLSVAVCASFGQTSLKHLSKSLPGGRSFFTSSSRIQLPGSQHSVLDSAQAEWVKYYSSSALKGHAEAAAVAVDPQGNIYVAGKAESPMSSYDYLTIKYSSAGVEIWSAVYDGPAHDFDAANAIVVDNAGNVYVTGVSSGEYGFDYATVKYNGAGQEQWVARYNGTGNAGDVPIAIAIDQNSNVYVTGESAQAGVGGHSSNLDFATVKYDQNGVQQWADLYGGAPQYDDQPIGVTCDHAGDVFVVGQSCDGPDRRSFSVAVIKYSSQGQRQWVAHYVPNDTTSAMPKDFLVDDSDNVVITGSVWSVRSPSWSSVTLKYNAIGFLQWSTFDSGPHTQGTVGMRTVTDHAGNIYVVGLFGGSYWWSYGVDSLSLCKYGPGGQLQWTSIIDDTDRMAPVDVALDPTGSPYVTWAAAPSYGYEKYYAIVTALFSASGDEEWRASYDTRFEPPYHNSLAAKAIACDPAGNLHIVGGRGGEQATDMLMLKYAPNGVRKWVHTKECTRSWDQVYAMGVDDSSNAYLTGVSSTGAWTSDILTVKYNSSGEMQWSARYGGSSYSHNTPCALRVDRLGGVYVLATGDSIDWGNGEIPLFVTMKYNSSGQQEWAATYPGLAYHDMYAIDMGIDRGGNAVVAGYRVWPPPIRYIAVKYNSSGDELWVATFDSTQGEGATALAVDDSNNIIVAGGRRIVKYDENGNERWVYSGGATAITVDNACNVYITSDTGSTRRLTPAGASVWSVPFAGNSIALDPSGNVLVRNSSGGLAKISSGGATLWNLPITDCLGSYMTLDNSGNTYVAGIHITSSAVEYQTRAFSPDGAQRWSTGFEDNGTNSWYQYPIAVSNPGDVYVGAVSQTGASSVYKTIKYRQVATSVREDDRVIPEAFSLSQNYPNPFNPSTTIRFALPKSGRVELKIFNALGQEVATLVNEDKVAGTYSAQWNAASVASGVYFYRLKAGEYTDTRKLLLLK